MDEKATALTRKRYERTARFYDLMQLFSERRSGPGGSDFGKWQAVHGF